ncbi:MAG: SH3 domain-containing protein [Candidatus Microgenomates bacterium]|jgi:hypothetical protein
MKALKIIALVIVVVLAISVAGVVGYKYLKPQKASIAVESNPSAVVYISGTQVGNTPYRGSWNPGEVVVKLIPVSPLIPYETKVNLVPGKETQISRDFGMTEDTSGGQVISYEKIGSNESSLSLLSTPDYAQVSVDGDIRGFSPIMNYSVSVDTHQIVVTKLGYLDDSFAITAPKGYKTVVMAQLISTGQPASPSGALAELGGISPTSSPSATQVYVQILDTPSGFLRVRAQGSTGSSEIARVKPGDKLLFVSQDTAGDWYQVLYDGKNKGWISSQYAKKLDQTGNAAVQNPNNQ